MEEVSEFENFVGHNEATSEAFEEWADKHRFFCHFTLMQIESGLYDETLFVCEHCGHTVDTDGIKSEVEKQR